MVSGDWPVKLAPGTALDLYRIVQEALQNAHKHAGASVIEVSLGLSAIAGLMSITVADDGRGLPASGELHPGQGIIGMRERAALLGGTLETERKPAGGTAVRVVVPLAAESPRTPTN
jgi:signal transduction histidine kinase